MKTTRIKVSELPYTYNMQLPSLQHMDMFESIVQCKRLKTYKKEFITKWGDLLLVHSIVYPGPVRRYSAVFNSHFKRSQSRYIKSKIENL